MKTNSILQAMKDEWQALIKDQWLFALVVWLPPLLVVFMIFVFSARLPTDLAVGVVDLDHSQLSRKVSRYIDASSHLNVVKQFSSVKEGHADIRDASIYALIVIPENFERNARRGEAPEVTGFFNAQYVLVAKSVRSTLHEVETTLAVELDVARIFPSTPVFQAALGKAMPARLQMTALYNQNMDYSQFLVPGLAVAVMQIIICCVTVLVLGRDFKLGQLEGWRSMGTVTVLYGKLSPYAAIFTLQMLLGLFMFFFWLDWPLNGMLAELLPAIILFVVACQLLGAFFYVLTFDLVRSLSIAGAFTAPAFAFLGITFPASEMSVFAQFWRDLMPASHYVEAYVLNTDYGVGVWQLLPATLLLLLYFILFPWVAYRIQGKITTKDV